jgi:hypothetical protein
MVVIQLGLSSIEQRLCVLENGVLKRKLGLKREDVTDENFIMKCPTV